MKKREKIEKKAPARRADAREPEENATHGSPKRERSETKRRPRRPRVGEVPEGYTEADGSFYAHRILTAEGVAVLEWRAAFPLPQAADPRAAERIRAFYIDLAARLQTYLQKDLLPHATRAYTESDDPHKRFRHTRLSLSVLSRVSEENERCFSVVREVRLVRGKRLLHTHTEAEVLSKKSGRPLPLSALCRMGFSFAEKDEKSPYTARKKAAKSGFFLQNGRIAQIPK